MEIPSTPGKVNLFLDSDAIDEKKHDHSDIKTRYIREARLDLFLAAQANHDVDSEYVRTEQHVRVALDTILKSIESRPAVTDPGSEHSAMSPLSEGSPLSTSMRRSSTVIYSPLHNRVAELRMESTPAVTAASAIPTSAPKQIPAFEYETDFDGINVGSPEESGLSRSERTKTEGPIETPPIQVLSPAVLHEPQPLRQDSVGNEVVARKSFDHGTPYSHPNVDRQQFENISPQDLAEFTAWSDSTDEDLNEQKNFIKEVIEQRRKMNTPSPNRRPSASSAEQAHRRLGTGFNLSGLSQTWNPNFTKSPASLSITSGQDVAAQLNLATPMLAATPRPDKGKQRAQNIETLFKRQGSDDSVSPKSTASLKSILKPTVSASKSSSACPEGSGESWPERRARLNKELELKPLTNLPKGKGRAVPFKSMGASSSVQPTINSSRPRHRRSGAVDLTEAQRQQLGM